MVYLMAGHLSLIEIVGSRLDVYAAYTPQETQISIVKKNANLFERLTYTHTTS